MPPQEQKRTIVIHRRHCEMHRAMSLSEHQVHTLFDELIHHAWNCRQFTAALDVLETEEAYFIEIELPGVAPEGIRVRVNNRVLVIEGKKDLARPPGEYHAHISERCEGSFSRTLQLPEAVAASDIEQFMKNGVLYLKVRKPQSHESERQSS